MTHAELVVRAVRWLRNTRKCTIAFGELATIASEIPDAIGWRPEGSVLVECKVSRSDFRRNGDKAHPWGGMGKHRWFLTPPGLVTASDMPEGWGLAEVFPRQVRPVVWPTQRLDYDWRSEILLLSSAIRRHELGIPFNPETGRFRPVSEEAR